MPIPLPALQMQAPQIEGPLDQFARVTQIKSRRCVPHGLRMGEMFYVEYREGRDKATKGKNYGHFHSAVPRSGAQKPKASTANIYVTQTESSNGQDSPLH